MTALEQCRALRAWGYARADDDQGLAALWKARDLAIACDAGEELARTHAGLNQSLRRLGRTAEREQVLRDAIRYAAAMGLRNSFWPAMNYFLAELLMDIGRWDEADEILRGLGERGLTAIHAMFTNAYRARLAAARGELATAIRGADRVAALAKELPDQPIPQAIAWCARAESCLWYGDAHQAMEYADLVIALTTDPMRIAEAVTIRARAAADIAERARRRGQPVGDLVTDARAWAATERRPQMRALVATTRAELSRHDRKRDPEPMAGSCGGVGCGRRSVPGGVLPLAPGIRAAWVAVRPEGCGAGAQRGSANRGPARRSAVVGIQRPSGGCRTHWGAGHPARRRQNVGRAAELGLTQRELEVLPLLVAGRTNVEIADALAISPRTVGVHVSRIMQKLGAARRTEAADIARRRGLVAD